MIRQPAHVEARRPPLRSICLVVKENWPTDHPKPVVPVGMTAKFPRRPDWAYSANRSHSFLSHATEQGFG